MPAFPARTASRAKDLIKRYGLAVIAIAVALTGRAALTPLLHDTAPFALLFAAVAFSALYCGSGPAILATLLGIFGSDYLFLKPRFTLAPPHNGQLSRVITFIFVSTVIIALTESNRRTTARREKAEQKLVENEELFRFTFEQAAVGMAHVGLDGRFLRVNQKLCDILGYSAKDLLQRTFQELTHPDYLEGDVRGMQSLTEGEITQYFKEKRYLRKDGSFVWIDVSVSLLRQSDSKPDYFITVIQDITERKRSEEALRLSQERLALAQRAGNSGSFDWDLRTKSHFWSDELLALYGFTRDSLPKNETWIEGVVAEDRERVDAALNDAAETGFLETEFRIRKHNNPEVRSMYARAQVLFDEQHKPQRVLGIQVDVTEQKRAEEALREAHRDLERKVQERTAELKEQVSERKRAEDSLRELTGRLLQLQDNERRQLARELHDSTGQMVVALSLNISSLQRGDKDSAEINRVVTDSLTLLNDLSSELRTISHLLHPPLLDEAGLSSALRWYVDGFSQRSKIDVSLDIEAKVGRLPQELETAIFRIVQECLTNIHRHAESPTANIRVLCTDEEISVQIEDQGRGIPSRKQFELTGAGLPGVGIRGMRERVRQLGGDVTIESNGSGTRVIATFPVSALSAVAGDALVKESNESNDRHA